MDQQKSTIYINKSVKNITKLTLNEKLEKQLKLKSIEDKKKK